MSAEHCSKSPQQEEVKFWDGHSFDDDCEWLPASRYGKDIKRPLISDFPIVGLLYSIPLAIRESLREQREYDQIFHNLQAFLALKSGLPIKKFNKNEVFNPSDLPKGSVIRFHEDFTSSDTKEDKPDRETYWGVVTQDRRVDGGYHDIVIGFSTKDLTIPNYPYRDPMFLLGEIHVGETAHERDIETGTILRERLESLIRINWVEVWQFGQEVRERNEVKQGFLGKLLPRSTQG